jgi:hypothetical protein
MLSKVMEKANRWGGPIGFSRRKELFSCRDYDRATCMPEFPKRLKDCADHENHAAAGGNTPQPYPPKSSHPSINPAINTINPAIYPSRP